MSNGLARCVAAGTFATITMDAAMLGAALASKEAFSAERLSLGVMGRWTAALAGGHWRQGDISLDRPIRGETALGVATHYTTGIVLTAMFLAVPRRRRPTLLAATTYGVATSALPLLVMFPSMGYGLFGSRSGEAARLNRIMLLGHLGFGLGIGIGARWASREGHASSGA